MTKDNRHDLTNKSSAEKNENLDNVNRQTEELSVQQRYHKEFLKYQEQINKVKTLSSCDNQAA